MVVAKRDPRVLVAQDYLAKRRKTRRPQHRFNLKIVPYEIQPFMIAPVLPGESLTDIMLQSQTWSDPLQTSMKNIGWWLHYNFFYVRHRDLPPQIRTTLANMFIKPDEHDPTDIQYLGTGSPGGAALYTYYEGADFVRYCLEHVVSEYFRDDGEDWNEAVGPNGLPLVQIYGRGTSDIWEHATLADDYGDERVDLIDTDGHLYANELDTMYAHWMAMRDAGLTEMDYQDFMRTYGSNVREDEESPNLHRAEDVWSFREFTYPTNTVEPTTGVPAVAAGWRVAKHGGKRIFCDEPGFIFGVTYARPKVYLYNQNGNMTGLMQSVQQWLPAVLHHQQHLGHVEVDATNGGGPVGNLFGQADEGNFWLDIRDLLLYGDQFVNWKPNLDGEDPESRGPFVDLPRLNGDKLVTRYVQDSQCRQFFADAFGTTGSFQMDGLCTLSVLGHVEKVSSAPQLALR